MCLAEDLNLHIYYQDTDSIPDFEEINGKIPTAVESYFIGKKLYLDHLVNDGGYENWHVRGKGLTKKSIAKQAERVGGYLNLYDMLYNGEIV